MPGDLDNHGRYHFYFPAPILVCSDKDLSNLITAGAYVSRPASYSGRKSGGLVLEPQGFTERLVACDVPAPGRVLIAARQEQPAVEAEGDATNRSAVAQQFSHWPAGRDFPESGCAIHAAGDHHPAVGAEGGVL